jgi:hypothetical protein
MNELDIAVNKFEQILFDQYEKKFKDLNNHTQDIYITAEFTPIEK